MVEVYGGLMRSCSLVQPSVNLAGCIEIGDEHVVVYFPVSAHVCHDDSVERCVQEHAVADNELAGHLSSDESDGFVWRIPHRHDASGLTSFRTSEAFVSRVCLGIFVYKSEIEEQPVHYDPGVPVGCRFYHQQSLAYGSPLFYARLDACGVMYLTGLRSVKSSFHPPSRLMYLPFIWIHPRSSGPR